MPGLVPGIHAYDSNGRQASDWQVYARIIEGIRAKVDIPVYPSYPAFTWTGGEWTNFCAPPALG